MSSKARFSSVLQRLIDAPDQATAEIRLNPGAFERSALEEQASSIINAALFQVGSMAFLLFDANGNRLAVEAPDWVPAVQHFDEIVARASRLGCNERLLSFSGNDGKLLHFLWAPRGETTSWNLPLHVRAAMQSAAADRVDTVRSTARATARQRSRGTARKAETRPQQTRKRTKRQTKKLADMILGLSILTAMLIMVSTGTWTGFITGLMAFLLPTVP